MDVKPLSEAFGAEVLGVDLAGIDAALGNRLLDLMADRALLLFRHQSLRDADLLRLAASFGRVEEPAATRSHSPQFKEVNYISNLHDGEGRLIGGLTRRDQDEGVWHTDQVFRKAPATISTLFCVHAPAQDGGTSFINTSLGYAALPRPLAAKAAALRAVYLPGTMHDVAPVPVRHPVVLRNPETGRPSLYLAPNALGFEGIEAEEGERIKSELLRYQMRDAHRYTHRWRMGDMLIYDNAQLLHRREAFRGLRWLKATRSFAPRDRFAVPGR